MEMLDEGRSHSWAAWGTGTARDFIPLAQMNSLVRNPKQRTQPSQDQTLDPRGVKCILLEATKFVTICYAA